MLRPHERHMASELTSSCSMQLCSILNVHGTTASSAAYSMIVVSAMVALVDHGGAWCSHNGLGVLPLSQSYHRAAQHRAALSVTAWRDGQLPARSVHDLSVVARVT